MKREIKFKVFDRFTVDKSIRLVGYEKLNKDGNWEYKREGRDEYILGTISDNQGNVIFTRVQYTGLKDKKGTEIFESDILDEKYKWVVYHSAGAYKCKVQNGDATKIMLLNDLINHRKRAGVSIEVIGNIHESPELLEQS